MKKIIVSGLNMNEVGNSMPTPEKNGKEFMSMSIVDDDRDLADCYLEKIDYHAFTVADDLATVKYGGGVEFIYTIDKNFKIINIEKYD